MKIKSICIVGGGSSGWMTAAAFSNLLKSTKITLVESPDISRIGVGESTIAEIQQFLDAIDVKDTSWMKECDASFKLGINFVDFHDKGKTFLYPFVNPASLRDPNDWFSFKLHNRNFEYSYTDYVLPEIALMCKKNRLTSDPSHPSFCVNRELGFGNHAYQIDAAKFSQYLKNKVAIPNGVSHFLDHVVEYNVVDEKLKSIKTKEGVVIEADLFIDCTGFRSSILEGVFKTKHKSFSHILFNDSAFFVSVPYTEETKNKELQLVTDCTAIDNGWVWNIPLWSRVGTGYVYSSKHVDKEIARSNFIDHLSARYGAERIKNLEPKSLEIRNGKHEKAWVSNVVGLGLSYGFIEPLESTGLFLVHETILALAEVLSQRDGNVVAAQVDVFNKTLDERIDYLLWFVAMHFFLSKREDTQYWRDCVENSNLKSHIDNPVYDFLSSVSRQSHSLSWKAYNYIGYNMDIIPISYARNKIKDEKSLIQKRDNFIKIYHDIEKIVNDFPTHNELLSQFIHK